METKLPDQLRVFEAFVNEDEEYPLVCLGVYEGEAGGFHFDMANLNSQANWYMEEAKAAGNRILPVALNQLEENAVLIGYDKYAKFVDKQGKLKPSNKQASQLSFDNKAQAIVRLQDCVLSFHKHGMQGKSLLTSQITAEVSDPTKIFRMLGSNPNIVIETKPAEDLSGASNLYILVSEEAS